MLPNMVSSIVTFFAMQAYGRVPAMLNFSTGSKNIISACQTATIKTIYTSRRFIENAKLQEIIESLQEIKVKIIYLEDLATNITLTNKIKYLIGAKFDKYIKNINKTQATDPAVILFTSGSEGVPKGVVLSHKNLQANRFQLASRIDFSSKDIVFNVLPIFILLALLAVHYYHYFQALKPSFIHHHYITVLFQN